MTGSSSSGSPNPTEASETAYMECPKCQEAIKPDHRKAMLRAMVTFLFETGKIETTATRAKEVRAMAEKMVTLGKREDLHAKRQVYGFITKESVAKKVIDEIGPKYADRDGGYTRIIKTGVRRGDAAEMAIIELV